MKNTNIIPISRFDDMIASRHNVFMNCCYLHGELAKDCGCDSFAISRSSLLPHGDKQIVPFQYGDIDCLFFYWRSFSGGTPCYRGLVVYQSDAQGVEYAQECYDRSAVVF